MDNINKDIAYCGLYCPQCSFRVAYETQRREHLLNMPEKYSVYKMEDLNNLKCIGCKKDDFCGDCEIKKCAEPRNINHCGECNDFPCSIIKDFSNDGIPHHKEAFKNLQFIQAKGFNNFIVQIEQDVICQCGGRLSWYLDSCIYCGKKHECQE